MILKRTLGKLKRKIILNSKNHKNSSRRKLNQDAIEVGEAVIVTDSWGMRFTHYPNDSENLEVVTKKEFYSPELKAMKRLVHKNATVIDVGANIGLFSVFISKEIGPKGKLVAFEPVGDTFWRMQENLALNRCMNVVPLQQALSNKKGKATMNIFPEGYGAWNTFGKPVFGDIKSIDTEKVEVTTLDAYMAENSIKTIDFLKIDVEGYERDVLEGARNTLKAGNVTYISFEISDIPLKGARRKPEDIFNYLKEYGYLAYEFDENLIRFKGPVAMSDTFYQNFYASKKDLRKL